MELLLLTADPQPSLVLPALRLLPHAVRVAAPQVTAVSGTGRRDAVLVDARTDLVAARSLCRRLGSVGLDAPVATFVTEHEHMIGTVRNVGYKLVRAQGLQVPN